MQAAPRFLCIPPSSQKMPSSQNQPKPGQLPMLDPDSGLLQESGLSLTPSLSQQGSDSQKKLWGEFPALSGPLKGTLPANNWAIHQSFLGIKKERASFYHWQSRARAPAEEQSSLRGTRKSGTVKRVSVMEDCNWACVGNLLRLKY